MEAAITVATAGSIVASVKREEEALQKWHARRWRRRSDVESQKHGRDATMG
jgi:hypothetical protein